MTSTEKIYLTMTTRNPRPHAVYRLRERWNKRNSPTFTKKLKSKMLQNVFLPFRILGELPEDGLNDPMMA